MSPISSVMLDRLNGSEEAIGLIDDAVRRFGAATGDPRTGRQGESPAGLTVPAALRHRAWVYFFFARFPFLCGAANAVSVLAALSGFPPPGASLLITRS
jgi:hypothetical protein